MSVARPSAPSRAWDRKVNPEILDRLPADDARAVRSRRDLVRINRLMGSLSALLRGLDRSVESHPMSLIELGAGDGTLMLRLARSRAARWPRTNVLLLDKDPAISEATAMAIRDLGWSAEIIAHDAIEWLEATPVAPHAVIIANLFVHHFAGSGLARLLAGIARHSSYFVCCEPRRSRLALAGSRLLGLIGCNEVTRHDAVVSVHAGFRDQELSAAWPAPAWRLEESAVGLFSHLFVAARER